MSRFGDSGREWRRSRRSAQSAPRTTKREGMMKFALGLLLSASVLMAQSKDSPDAHVAAAKTLAGQDYVNLFNTTCSPPQTGARGQGGGQRQGPPDRATWH